MEKNRTGDGSVSVSKFLVREGLIEQVKSEQTLDVKVREKAAYLGWRRQTSQEEVLMREWAWNVGGSAGRPVREAGKVRSQLLGDESGGGIPERGCGEGCFIPGAALSPQKDSGFDSD